MLTSQLQCTAMRMRAAAVPGRTVRPAHVDLPAHHRLVSLQRSTCQLKLSTGAGLKQCNRAKTSTRNTAQHMLQSVKCQAVKEGTQGIPSFAGDAERAQLPLEAKSCCHSGEGEDRPSPAASSSTADNQLEGDAGSATIWSAERLALFAALVGVPLTVLALNPSLVPFDTDAVLDWLDESVYSASHEINRALNLQLGLGSAAGSPLSPGVVGLVFGAGLITSFAPCTLSVLPLTIGYIAGFNPGSASEGKEAPSVTLNALFFSLGLASSFSALGISAALAGKAYGQMGPGLPIAVSAVTMYMGLNLLGLVRFQMPSLFANFDPKEAAASLPVAVQMYLGGLTFALLASPCSTPVLASLLGYVASSEDVVIGFALLLAYTFGRVMPVLAAASVTGSMKQMLSLRQYSRWINPASGALLLGIGTFSLLNRVFPESIAMAAPWGM